MDTILKWTNLNVGSFTTKIYRGLAPLDRANLSDPIATLTAGESTYTDTTTVRGTLYYYVFETIKGSDKVPSNNIAVRAVPRKGPGPEGIIQGDYTYGYFGSLLSSEFINTPDLSAAIGLTGGAVYQAGPVWHKWIRKGKILYIPQGAIRSGVPWNALYASGAVFGVDGPGPRNPGSPVNQTAKVQIGQDWFKVRLMTGYDDNLVQLPSNPVVITEATETYPNEWNDLVYPLSQWVPDLQRMANVQQFTNIDLPMQASILVQDKSASASSAVTRGSTANTRAGVAQRNLTPYTTGSAWMPVLELIES